MAYIVYYLCIISAYFAIVNCGPGFKPPPPVGPKPVNPIILFNYDDSGIRFDHISGHSDDVIVAEKSDKLIKTSYKVSALDADFEGKYFVWSVGDYPYPIVTAQFDSKTDPQTGRTRLQIYRQSLIITSNRKSSVSVDWVHDLIYYFNYTNLNVVDVNRPEISYQLTDFKPREYASLDFSTGSIAVNPYDSFIVWSEYMATNGSAVIRRCNEDGSDPKILVYKDIRLPICMAIDFATQTIVWIDNELHSLSSIDYMGNNRKTLKQSKQHFGDCSSMDVFNGSVYWTSPKVNKIYRLDTTGNPMTAPIEPMVTSEWDIDFVRFMHKTSTGRPVATNYCQNNTCDHICVPNGQRGHRCLCSDTHQLSDCHEPRVLYPKPAIPVVKQETGSVGRLTSSGDPLLLFTAEKRDIRLTRLPTGRAVHYTETEFMYPLDHYATAIDYSLTGNYLTWLNINTDYLVSKTSLMAAPFDTSRPTSLSTGDGMAGLITNMSETRQSKTLAVDWIHGVAYLPICSSYVTNKGIYAVNLTAPERQYLVVQHSTCMVKDVKVDAIESLMFWVQYNESSASTSSLYTYSSASLSSMDRFYVKRSTLSGQSIETLAFARYIRKNTLTLDITDKRLYWLEMESIYTSTISLTSIGYDGTDRKVVLSSRTIFNDLVISSTDLFMDYIYISDLENDTVIRLSKHESIGAPVVDTVLQCGVDVDSIKIVHKTRQPDGPNRCLNHNCPSLCLPTAGAEPSYTCYCRPTQTWSGSACVGGSSGGTGGTISGGGNGDTGVVTVVPPWRRWSSATLAPVPAFPVLDNQTTRLLYVVYKEGVYVKENVVELNQQYIETKNLVANTRWITELDYDYDRNCMYWLESSTAGESLILRAGVSLYGAPIDRSRESMYSTQRLLTTMSFTSKRLAYDWLHQLVYTSTPKGVQVFNVGSDPLYVYDVVKHTDTQLDVAVDPIQGVLVWSQYAYDVLSDERQGLIMRANQDGTGAQKLVTSARLPTTLALDADAQVVYWIDNQLYSLHSVDYTGLNSKTILRDTTLFEESFSMDVFGEYVFWSNYEKNTVFKTHRSGANGTERLALVTASTDIEGVRVLDQSRQPAGANRCENTNCSQLCLPAGRDYRCVCSKDSVGDCIENTPIHLINPSPYHSPAIDTDNHFMQNLSLKLDSLLKSTDQMTGGGSGGGSPTHWVIITLISISFNLIFILFFIVVIYNKKKPIFDGIISFRNNGERIMLDESSLNGDL